jgi:hypothetical protein
MLGNVVGHYDAKENVYPRKERPENKIDGAVRSSWRSAVTWSTNHRPASRSSS